MSQCVEMLVSQWGIKLWFLAIWVSIIVPRLPRHHRLTKQECIPVGCIPSAAVAVSPGGQSRPPPRADTPKADTPQEQTPPWSRHPHGSRPPWEQTPPPRGQTYDCKSITFATSLRTVKKVLLQRISKIHCSVGTRVAAMLLRCTNVVSDYRYYDHYHVLQ